MRKSLLLLALILCLAALPAAAGTEEEEAATAEEAAKARRAEFRERVNEALGLPQTAKESRDAGVPEEKVQEVLEAARTRGVPASETRKILVIENEEIRRGGDPENFGAVVHHLKESGLRGRELAEAIHAEQIARGMKKPKMKHHMKGKGKGKGEWRDKQRTEEEPEKMREKKGASKTREKN
jgi:hypothetical protein